MPKEPLLATAARLGETLVNQAAITEFLENLRWLGADARLVEVVGEEVVLHVSARRSSPLRKDSTTRIYKMFYSGEAN